MIINASQITPTPLFARHGKHQSSTLESTNLMDSHHKGPAIQKTSLYHDIIMKMEALSTFLPINETSSINSSPPSAAIFVWVNWPIIGSYNGLLPVRHQAIIWTNAGLLSIGSLRTIFSEILVSIPNFSSTKMHLKISSAKWQPFCPICEELKYFSTDKTSSSHRRFSVLSRPMHTINNLAVVVINK